MDKPRYFYKDTFHHLYNRGANKQVIFFDNANYLYFLERLRYYKVKYKIDILSYCLMPNHFHLFVRQIKEELSIVGFISCFLNSYTKSINKSYKRSGTLFESKTKSKQIIDDAYFKWVIKYILENPVKAGLEDKISDWEYSNAKDLLNFRNGNLTNIAEVKSYFFNEAQMKEFLNDKT
jgi:putative transposase